MAQKTKKQPKVLRLLGTLVLVCLLGYFCYMYINQEIVFNRQNEQIARMEAENALLEEEYQKMLQGQNENVLEHIEKYMRTHFGMVQSGQTRLDIEEE